MESGAIESRRASVLPVSFTHHPRGVRRQIGGLGGEPPIGPREQQRVGDQRVEVPLTEGQYAWHWLVDDQRPSTALSAAPSSAGRVVRPLRTGPPSDAALPIPHVRHTVRHSAGRTAGRRPQHGRLPLATRSQSVAHLRLCCKSPTPSTRHRWYDGSSRPLRYAARWAGAHPTMQPPAPAAGPVTGPRPNGMRGLPVRCWSPPGYSGAPCPTIRDLAPRPHSGSTR